MESGVTKTSHLTIQTLALFFLSLALKATFECIRVFVCHKTKNSLTVSFALFLSFAHALCDRYDAQIRPNDVSRKLEAKRLENEIYSSGIRNPNSMV